jgi:glycopeptide antibiotics resistance protein
LSGLFGVYPCPYRLFEIDDLMTNTAGAMIGFILFRYINFLPTLENKKIEKVKEANITQRVLVNSFDSLLFLLALGIVGSDGDNIVKNIS